MTNTFKQFALCEENGKRVILYYSSELTLVRTASGKWKKVADLSYDEFPTPQETHENFYLLDRTYNDEEFKNIIEEVQSALIL